MAAVGQQCVACQLRFGGAATGRCVPGADGHRRPRYRRRNRLRGSRTVPGRGDASTKDTVTALTTNIERKRPGRPPGTSDTRARILECARNLFARNGIDKTSIRAIAKDAGVDPALVHHYFGTKTQLFAS